MSYAAAALALAFPFGGAGEYRPAPQAVAPPAAVTVAAAEKSYGGHTTQGGPIVVRTSGRKVTDVVIDVRAACDSKMVYPVEAWLDRSGRTGIPFGSGGSLSRRGAFRVASGFGTDLGTQNAAIVTLVKGKLGASRSKGTVQVDVTIADKATGQTVDHCAAGYRWVENVPERRVYAGVSDQVTPIVLELTKSRRAVKAFWFGLNAPCTPDGAISPIDVVVNFPIRNGRFGDQFSDDGSDGAGGTVHVDYSLAGRIGRRSARGTIGITATDRDAGGNTLSTCSSGDVGWVTTQ